VNTTAQNLVTGIVTIAGSCDLEYTASVTDGTGQDEHTYTTLTE